MGKKGKKKKGEKVEVEEDIPGDLKELSQPMLKDRIEAFHYRLNKAMKERNYMQLEKDMVNRFYEITKQEVKQIEAELLNMDRQMEMLERDHRVHIKVHEQKVQNLEYEHKNGKRQVTQEGEMSIQKERDIHTDNVVRMNREKMDIKAELERTRLANVEDVGVLNKRFRSQLEKLRQTFEQNHRQLESQYEEQVQQLRRLCQIENAKEVQVGTTESFQGCEKRVIILSTVRSRELAAIRSDKHFSIGFLGSYKRTNVALSRAKSLLVVVGNLSLLATDKQWKAVIEVVREMGCLRGAPTESLEELATESAEEALPNDDEWVVVSHPVMETDEQWLNRQL